MKPIEKSTRYYFGGHEKFVFRNGWLKKGVDAVSQTPSIFTEDEALVILGVGKNMVRSIRHWCLATGVIQESTTETRSASLIVSDFGNLLLSDKGYDPYLEELGSLWLLHWRLCTNNSRSLAWHLIFSKFIELEFTKKHLVNFLSLQLSNLTLRTTIGTIEREIDVLIRTYIPNIRTRSELISDETLDCPLAELGLLSYIHEDNLLRFNVGPKNSLPIEIFGYAFLEFLASNDYSKRTISVDECLYKLGSPGQIFKLDENSVIEYFESLDGLTNGSIRLHETAGLRQVYLETISIEDYQILGNKLLKDYYKNE